MPTISYLLYSPTESWVTDGYTGNVFGPFISSQQAAVVDIYKPDRVKTPKPSGWLYPKPYSFFKRRAVGDMAEVKFTKYGTEYHVATGRQLIFADNVLYGLYLPAGQAEIDKAVTKALLKLKDQKFNAGVAFGESQRTADLLGSSAIRIARSIRLFRKGRIREAMRQLKTPKKVLRKVRKTGRGTPNEWLQLQYGWLPLLSEIKGATDLISSPREVRDQVVTVKGTYRRKEHYSFERNPSPTGTEVWEGDAEVGVYVRLDYYPDDYYLALASSLGLTNPLEIVWELTPYSFVLDWMLPIGDWLSSLDAALGFQFLSGSCSVRQVVKGENTRRTYDSYPYSHCSNTGRTLVDVKRLDRTVYTSSPLPHAPRLKNPLSLKHMANGLSLLAQALGRK